MNLSLHHLTCERNIANIGEKEFSVWNWLDLLAHREQTALHTILGIYLREAIANKKVFVMKSFHKQEGEGSLSVTFSYQY